MHVDPAAVLPQRAPFRFVDQVVSVSDDACHCTYRVPREGPCFSLRMDPALFLIEALAQTAAVYAAERLSGDRRGPVEGVLGGVDGFRVHGRPRPGAVVDLRARLRKRLGPVLLFDVAATCGGEALVEARLTVRQGGVE